MASDGEIEAPPPTELPTSSKVPRRLRRLRTAPANIDFIPSETKTSVTKSFPSASKALSMVSNCFHPSFEKLAVVVFVYLGLGTVCFYLVRHEIKGTKTNAILDALYFTVVTLTSVGYGDLAPNSNLTKLFASLFVILGTVLVGIVLTKIADYLVEKQELLLKKALVDTNNNIETNVDTLNEMKTTKQVRNKCILLVAFFVVLIVAGMVVLIFIEDLDFVYAFYCVVATITSLGYTDKCFSTKGGRVFAIFWISSGTIYLGQLVFTIFVLYTQRRRWELIKWALKRKTTPADMMAADLNCDGVVSEAEFIFYKLKDMGKINQEDIMLIMEEFERSGIGHVDNYIAVSD